MFRELFLLRRDLFEMSSEVVNYSISVIFEMIL